MGFFYAERHGQLEGLFPVEYRMSTALRTEVARRRVAIVNDVINAGSAGRGAYGDLLACGAEPVALPSLLHLRESAVRFAEEKHISPDQPCLPRESNLDATELSLVRCRPAHG